MPKPRTGNWKAVERDSARLIGGRRLPNQGVRACDIAHPRYFIEHKQRPSTPEWWTLALQALDDCPPHLIPLLIFAHAPGQGKRIHRYVILSLDDPRVQELLNANHGTA